MIEAILLEKAKRGDFLYYHTERGVIYLARNYKHETPNAIAMEDLKGPVVVWDPKTGEVKNG